MSTAMTLCKPAGTGLVLAQAAWDQFFEDALSKFDHPNPNLCCDLALDKTIRALGHRPRAPLTPEERADLEVRAEVEQLIAAASEISGPCRREFFEGLDSAIEPDPEDELRVEDLCDALDDCEVPC